MPLIKVGPFGGIRPKVASHLLGNNEAQLAQNVDIRDGSLAPIQAPSQVIDPQKTGTLQAIYKYAASGTPKWFHWLGDVDCVQGPIPGDTTERTYYTGTHGEGSPANYPRMTWAALQTGADYPTSSYRLGLPAPDVVITATPQGASCDVIEEETRVYAYTYVSTSGEEGPPSGPSTAVTCCPAEQVNLSAMSVAPSGDYDVVSKNIYRTVTTATGETDYLYVGNVAVATTTFNDTVAAASLGEAIPSIGWIAPPTTLVGLTAMANGIFAGFSGKDIYFTPPYQPHAWPIRYRLTVKDAIVGLGAFGTSLLVMTEGEPAVISGTDPAYFSMEKLEISAPCIAKRGIVDLGYVIAYPSPQGIMIIGQGRAELATRDVLKQDDWVTIYKTLSYFRAGFWDGKYVFSTSDGAGDDETYILDPNTGTLTSYDAYYSCFHTDYLGNMYVGSGENILLWNGGSAATPVWTSKLFEFPRDVKPAIIQIDAVGYNVTIDIYDPGGNLIVTSLSITSNKPQWLASELCVRGFYFRLTGGSGIREVRIGKSLEDLLR